MFWVWSIWSSRHYILKKLARQRSEGEEESSRAAAGTQAKQHTIKEAGFGEWMTVQCSQRRLSYTTKGNRGSSMRGNDGNITGARFSFDSGGDQAIPKQNLLRKPAARMLQKRRECMLRHQLRASVIKGNLILKAVMLGKDSLA